MSQTKTYTYEDILALFAQSDARFQARMAENDAQFKARMAENDARIAASNARIDALFAQTDAQMARTDARIDALFAQTDAQMARTDARIDKLAKLYGNLSENQGSVAEEFFFNSLTANPVIGGIQFDRVMGNVVIGSPSKRQEFDIVLVNGNSVAVLEVKQKAHVSTLDQLEKQLHRYREAFPEYANYKLYGGVAGLSVPDSVVEEAHERGMFVLRQKGDVITVDAEAMRAF